MSADMNLFNAAILRALDDLHSEFEKASANLDKEYAGPSKTADARTQLIETYSTAVTRVATGVVPMVTMGEYSAPAATLPVSKQEVKR